MQLDLIGCPGFGTDASAAVRNDRKLNYALIVESFLSVLRPMTCPSDGNHSVLPTDMSVSVVKEMQNSRLMPFSSAFT